MRHWFLITLLVIASGLSHAVEIVKDGTTYYLRGSCEDSAKEVANFSQSVTVCECSNNSCLTEISSHLSPQIQTMLTQPTNAKGGPNCWNSILFALGLHQGLHYSELEINFWLNSPFCKKRSGPPEPGDLVNVTKNTPILNRIEQWHTYQVLSPNLAFNKSSPNLNDPYEIIPPSVYMDRENIPESCRFASGPQCELTSTAYQCQSLDKVMDSANQDTEASQAQMQLQSLTMCSEEIVRNGTNLNLENLNDLADVVSALALEKMAVPSYETMPQDLRALLDQEIARSCTNCSQELKSAQRIFYIPMIFLFASPEMNLDGINPGVRALILKARESNLYSRLPEKEKFMWINIYQTSRSLRYQFNYTEMNL